jgi:hypothetical protein
MSELRGTPVTLLRFRRTVTKSNQPVMPTKGSVASTVTPSVKIVATTGANLRRSTHQPVITAIVGLRSIDRPIAAPATGVSTYRHATVAKNVTIRLMFPRLRSSSAGGVRHASPKTARRMLRETGISAKVEMNSSNLIACQAIVATSAGRFAMGSKATARAGE